MSSNEEAKTKDLPCSKCNGVARVPTSYGWLVYIGTPTTARTGGMGSYCPKCKLFFCSLHAVWKMIKVENMPPMPDDAPQILNPHCPECGSMMTGFDS